MYRLKIKRGLLKTSIVLQKNKSEAMILAGNWCKLKNIPQERVLVS